MDFKVEIHGITELRAALDREPEIARPTLQRAIDGSQALLAKHTTRDTVPWKTGYLTQTFQFQSGNLFARWFPTAAYAPFVEFGTKPHVIKVVNKRVLANVKEGKIFGPLVHHPGTKPNQFMERILGAATPEINGLFAQAAEIIVRDIAAAAHHS